MTMHTSPHPLPNHHRKSLSVISHLLLTWFWQKFRTQFLEAVIYFDQHFCTKFWLTESFLDLQIFLETKSKKNFTQNFFRSKNFVNPKFCWPIILLDPNFFGPTFFGTWFLSWPKLFLDQIFLHPKFCLYLFWLDVYEQSFLVSQIFSAQISLNSKFLWTQNIFGAE